MIKIFFFTFLSMFNIYLCFGQNEKFIRVKSGEDPGKVIPFAVKYRFDKFQTGTVTFFTGKAATARLNYNILLGEMQFIDLTGDTLTLDNESTIKFIKIGPATFYYDTRHGFMEALTQYPDITLAKKEMIKPASIEKMGAYNQSSSVSSIDSYSSYTGRNGSYNKLEPKGDIVLAKDNTYFLVDKNYRIRKASKAGLLKIFPRHKQEIASYMEKEAIDFDKESDLIKLTQFCHTSAF